MTIAFCDAERIERSRLANQLKHLIVQLDTSPCPDVLHPLLTDCTAAIEESLDVARDRERDPMPPTSELAWLTEMMLISEPREVVGVLRQIRRVLGRLDSRTE
jgi:hypothetical protein